MKAESSGKIKTTIQLIAAFTIMTLLVLLTWQKAGTLPYPLGLVLPYTQAIVWWLTVIAALFTLFSGFLYLRGHRELIYRSWSERKKQ